MSANGRSLPRLSPARGTSFSELGNSRSRQYADSTVIHAETLLVAAELVAPRRSPLLACCHKKKGRKFVLRLLGSVERA
jgi:hypothetical protein